MDSLTLTPRDTATLVTALATVKHTGPQHARDEALLGEVLAKARPSYAVAPATGDCWDGIVDLSGVEVHLTCSPGGEWAITGIEDGESYTPVNSWTVHARCLEWALAEAKFDYLDDENRRYENEERM